MVQLSEERSLKERLQPRIAVEEQFAATGRKYRNKPFLLKHERYWLRPLIKYGLKAVGLYGKGVQNALSPVVTRLRLEYANLPAAFDGFQILHLSDLHIDGVDGLAEGGRDGAAGSASSGTRRPTRNVDARRWCRAARAPVRVRPAPRWTDRARSSPRRG